jgi:hypothetical protein
MSDEERCPECGTFAGGFPKLIYNPDGDNYLCPECRGTGRVQGRYDMRTEPPIAGYFDCPLCRQPVARTAEREYEPRDLGEIPV